MKKFLVAALLLLMVGSTSLAFAWWDSLETTENEVTVGIGQGVTLQVNLAPQATDKLVPVGAVSQPDQVDEIVLTYNVNLDRTIEEELDLEVEVKNIQIGNSSDNAGLVNVAIGNPGSIENDPVTVTLTVTLGMPGSQAIYEAIKTQNITFDVTFTASQPE